MRRFARGLTESAARALRSLGLYEAAVRLRARRRLRPYRGVERFSATLNDVTVQFSTEDEYSSSWFFPRYAGGRIHERAATEMLVEALASASCFVDVGAHLGWYTCMAAKHMPSGRVYGFEMDDLSFGLLEKNVAVNHCANVEVFNVAVSGSTGVATYRRDAPRPNPGLRLRAEPEDGVAGSSVSVATVTLDEFLTARGIVPGVIKIDVEGAELEVLMGMRRTMRRHRPLLFLEVHPRSLGRLGTSVSAVLALLIDHGYRVFEIENMRGHGSERRLDPLRRESILRSNTMLYATAAG